MGTAEDTPICNAIYRTSANQIRLIETFDPSSLVSAGRAYTVLLSLARGRLLDVRRSTFDVRRSTFDIRRSTSPAYPLSLRASLWTFSSSSTFSAGRSGILARESSGSDASVSHASEVTIVSRLRIR